MGLLGECRSQANGPDIHQRGPDNAYTQKKHRHCWSSLYAATARVVERFLVQSCVNEAAGAERRRQRMELVTAEGMERRDGSRWRRVMIGGEAVKRPARDVE